jgi:hypothetical protein
VITNKKTTTPRPFVFVLMPFSEDFGDIYELGIRDAADDAGAYAERVDDQIFTEGILDRIFNQINKADVIVADMTDQNPNVFYEVGYAHALGKTVLLITQKADDIPFDLKHRPHIIYEGKITDLRSKLAKRLKWAIREAKKQMLPGSELSVYIEGQPLPEKRLGGKPPVITFPRLRPRSLSVAVRNDSGQTFLGSSHVYLMSEDPSPAVPCRIRTKKIRYQDVDESDGTAFEVEREQEEHNPLKSMPLPEDVITDNLRVQFKLPVVISPLPPQAVDQFEIPFNWQGILGRSGVTMFRLRIHSAVTHNEFDFYLEV